MNITIGVVGLGYVGLPLVIEFGRHVRRSVLHPGRQGGQCRAGTDPSREIPDAEMARAGVRRVHRPGRRPGGGDFVIVAVPTPVDEAHIPDFGPLVGASRAIAPHLKPGATVIYESTVYPGATEEVCIPVLEQASGKTWKRDFFVGYSPERINPATASTC